jgi:hypothetical protein
MFVGQGFGPAAGLSPGASLTESRSNINGRDSLIQLQ